MSADTLIVAGDSAQARAFISNAHLNPRACRIVSRDHDVRGHATGIVAYLVGTYYERRDWPDIEGALFAARADVRLTR